MNDPSASGQRGAGPEWQLLSLLTKVSGARERSERSFKLSPSRERAWHWTRMAITFPANQGSQGFVSEASGALNFPPRGASALRLRSWPGQDPDKN